MERTHNATLHDRPKPFDGVGMDRTVDVFPCTVTDNAMRVTVAPTSCRSQTANCFICSMAFRALPCASPPILGAKS